MNTVNTDIAPSWFPSETPEERVYWRAGVRMKPECNRKWLSRPDRYLIFYATERAAWIDREYCLSSGDFIATDPTPQLVGNKDAVTARAKERNAPQVKIIDEQGNIVEEWTV